MSNGGPSIGLVRTSTSGHAVVELTSSRIDSPPRCVSNRTSPNKNDDTDVVDSRAEGISVSDLIATHLLWFPTSELSCSLVSRKSEIPNRQISAQDL